MIMYQLLEIVKQRTNYIIKKFVIDMIIYYIIDCSD